MTNRALIAFDGSQEGREAIGHAWQVLRCQEAVVLHVFEPPQLPIGVPGVPVMPSTFEEQTREAQQRAAAIAREGCEVASSSGFRARHICVEGSGITGVAGAIVRAADEHDADAIVVAVRDRSRLLQILFGSVSDTVVHRSDRPVLVMPSFEP